MDKSSKRVKSQHRAYQLLATRLKPTRKSIRMHQTNRNTLDPLCLDRLQLFLDSLQVRFLQHMNPFPRDSLFVARIIGGWCDIGTKRRTSVPQKGHAFIDFHDLIVKHIRAGCR